MIQKDWMKEAARKIYDETFQDYWSVDRMSPERMQEIIAEKCPFKLDHVYMEVPENYLDKTPK